MNTRTLIAAGILALAAPCGAAFAQGGLYVLHSEPAGGCPGLDWHVVVGRTGALSGIVGWDNMKHLARVTGAINREEHTFQMTANEIGGAERAATIDGRIESDGVAVATIKGPNIECKDVTIPYFKQPAVGGGGG